MSKIELHWLINTLFVALAVASVAGCADQAALGPDQASPAEVDALTEQDGAFTRLASDASKQAPDLGVCDSLKAPEGSKLVATLYATGVQVYRWNGTSWAFIEPSALLFRNSSAAAVIGTHYAGPTWESRSGSKVVGAVQRRCTPDPTAIQWLLLGAVSSQGPGIFRRVTFIQRINTVGGLAPSTPGSSIGEEASVPYTTDYLFYRSE